MSFEDLINQWARGAHVSNWRQQARKHKQCCVYILRSQGLCKIGRTENLTKRMKSLQTGNPSPMELAHVIFTEEHIKVEQALHLIFAESRSINEWFLLSLKDLATIKSLSVQQILNAAKRLEKPSPMEPIVPPDQMTFGW